MRFIPDERLPIENTPKMEGFRCQAIAFSIFFALTVLPLLMAIYVWYEYDWMLAVGFGLFFYLVSAIVGSKLRLMSVPADQRERNLSSMDIAKWYTKYHFCRSY